MPPAERSGCLFSILNLFGLVPAPQRLPYSRAEHFLTRAELNFYRVLRTVVTDRYLICPKVRMADIIQAKKGEGWQTAFNRISAKHVDFLLCDPDTVTPLLAIELDDASHKRKDRADRDVTVDAIFAAAALPLLHIPAARTYSPTTLQQQIQQSLTPNP